MSTKLRWSEPLEIDTSGRDWPPERFGVSGIEFVRIRADGEEIGLMLTCAGRRNIWLNDRGWLGWKPVGPVS